MAMFERCSDLFGNCQPPNEFLDYGLFIPGDEYRPLPEPEEEDSDSEKGGMSEEEKRKLEEEKKKQGEDAVAALVKTDEMKEKFDKHSGGGQTITAKQAGILARELGLAPNEEDVKKLEEEKQDKVTLQDAKDFLVVAAHPEDSRDHLLEFFQHYDTARSGKLSKKQVKNLLCNFGEPLSEQEVDQILAKCGCSSDPVEYEKLVDKLLEKPNK